MGILTNLSHTIEVMQQHEEQWRRRLEREVEKRRRMEETQRAMAQEMAQLRQLLGLRAVVQTSTGATRAGHHARLQSCGQIDLRRLQSAADFYAERRSQGGPDNRALFNLVGPDFQEGPNSQIREEEFFDAIDAESDKIERESTRELCARCFVCVLCV